MKLYSTSEAAEYLRLSISGLKHHVYNTKRLCPVLVGKTLVFTKDQLDFFKANRRKPGRPRLVRQNTERGGE